MKYILCRSVSLDIFEVFVDGLKKVDGTAYGSFDMSNNMDQVDVYIFVEGKDGGETELFYANNTIKWMPGPSGTWCNYLIF